VRRAFCHRLGRFRKDFPDFPLFSDVFVYTPKEFSNGDKKIINFFVFCFDRIRVFGK